jgi:hypothetical protein
MDWTSPFIVYRITSEGKLQEVFHCSDIKKAKYWLQYIAQAGDVLCKTPAHPKHSKATKKAEYWSHKAEKSGPCTEEKKWREFAKTLNLNEDFPEEQLSLPTE